MRCSSAPVNAPLRWPNSSLSISVSGSAPQLTGTNGLSARRLCSCSARATSSLPVPVSPRISTVEWVGATLAISCRTRSIDSFEPTRFDVAFDPVQPLLQARYLFVSSRFWAIRDSSDSNSTSLQGLVR